VNIISFTVCVYVVPVLYTAYSILMIFIVVFISEICSLYQVITFYADGCNGNIINIQASLLSGCSNTYTGKYKKSTCLLPSGELQTSLCSDNQCIQNCTSPTSEVCTTASNSTLTCSFSLPTLIPGVCC
jgi:hypothetical protein